MRGAAAQDRIRGCSQQHERHEAYFDDLDVSGIPTAVGLAQQEHDQQKIDAHVELAERLAHREWSRAAHGLRHVPPSRVQAESGAMHIGVAQREHHEHQSRNREAGENDREWNRFVQTHRQGEQRAGEPAGKAR